jgi:ATP-dependent helicase HrpA
VRDRPLEQQQAADEKHKKFDDEKSEFMATSSSGSGSRKAAASMGTGRRPARSGQPQAQQPPAGGPAARDFVNPRRVREWRDIHSQLHTVVAEHGWRLNQSPATYEQIHMAMLAGLLGNIGCKSDDEDWYLGARGIKFWRHPGAHLSKKPGRWIVAAELVETTRLFGRGLAAIEPQWLEASAATCSRSSCWSRTGRRRPPRSWRWSAPRSTASSSTTSAGELRPGGPKAAREIFIREALVNGEWDSRLPFIAHNRKLIAQVEELEHKSRRQDVLVDDELIHAFYDQQVPPRWSAAPPSSAGTARPAATTPSC